MINGKQQRIVSHLKKYLFQCGWSLSILAWITTDQDHMLYGLHCVEFWSSKYTVILRKIIEHSQSYIFYLFHFTLYGAVHDATDFWRQNKFLFHDRKENSM